jgi:hypothetical protein
MRPTGELMMERANEGAEKILCSCGKIIGTISKDRRLLIRHKGRIVEIRSKFPGACAIEITCDRDGCGKITKILL